MEFLLIVVLMVSSYTHSTANDICNQSTGEPWKNPYLPQTIQPVHYHLILRPDFYNNASVFTGSNTIRFKAIEATNTILVHMKDLDITTTKIIRSRCAKKPNVARAFKYDNYWVMQLNETMEASNCTSTLFLEFNGNITIVDQDPNKSFTGFYKMKYINDTTGQESWLVATYFSPIDSRLAFPSFDEPQFKAPFRITLKHWENFTALSNMEIMRKDINNESIWIDSHFKLSPPMSSYLVSFIICDYSFKANTLVSGQPNRVWARPDRIDKVDYALNVTPAVENFLRREFDIAYPLDKLDHVALPHLEAFGLENWGLIAYMESVLLVDVNKNGYFGKQTALHVIAHELAHNYFGNLVTCRSWSHVWLKEGFSWFYGHRAAREVEPTLFYAIRVFYYLEQTMSLEAENKTNALAPVLSSPDEAKGLFDLIRYVKGGAIVRMLESVVGPANFKSGVRRYLRDNLYKTVETSDLWAALQQNVNDSSLNLEEVMKTWIYKPGYPIVFVLPFSDYHFMIAQKRFLSDSQAVHDCSYTWHIPLNYRTKGGSDGLVWLKENYAIFEFSLDTPDDWIQFNYDANGYYRVNYHPTLWERIANQLNDNYTIFSEVARWKLICDAKTLHRVGDVNDDTFLSLIRYSSKERAVETWLCIVDVIDELKNNISKTSSFSLFQRYILNLTSVLMDELEVKEKVIDANRTLRPKMISLSCSAGHRGCIDNTTEMFKEWIENATTNAIPVEYQKSVFCVGVANSVLESEWNTVYERFKVTAVKSTDERIALVTALACSRNATLLKRLLEYAINDTGMNYDERRLAFSGIASNPASENCVFEWLQLNYTDSDVEVTKLRSHDLIYATVVNVVTMEQRDKVLDFLNHYPFVSSDKMPIYREIMARNLRWMEKNFPSIVNWLEHNVLDY